MSLTQHDRLARALALAVPALLLGGAYLGQYGFDLYPCEMCWWQRWPHFVAVGFALLAYLAPPQRIWAGIAAVSILVSGAIGLFHAGVEYGWWEGITSCTAITSGGTGNALEDIMNAPMIRCDEAPWTLVGISLAGFNFLISTVAGTAILVLLRKRRQA